MPPLSEAQTRKMGDRAVKAQKIAENDASGSTKRSTPPPVSFAVMAACGNPIVIGGQVLEIAPFVMSKLPTAGRLLVACPEILVSHAIANKDEQGFDIGRTTAFINRQQPPDAQGSTEQDVANLLGTVGVRLTEEEAAAMVSLVQLAAQRRQPDIARDALDEGMDIPTFLQALRLILRENPNLADPT